MRAVQASRAGGPEVLALVDIPRPEPGPGEIRIRQAASGVNFIDTYYRSGLYPAPFPQPIGREGAGVVDAVGEGVTRFGVGDPAAYAMLPGSYAEAVVVPEARAVRVPEAMDLKVVAASLLRGMTAEFCLRRCAPVHPGQSVLIHAAAGGLGLILVQWAKALGVRTIGTVGSEAKADIARAHGCEEVILYDREDVAERVRALTGGEGVPIVYDGVGAATFEASLKSTARRGLVVCIGNASGAIPPFAPTRLAHAGSLFITRPTLGDYVRTTEELDDSASALFDVVASGAVKIEIGAQWQLEEAQQAHEALEARKIVGGSILVI